MFKILLVEDNEMNRDMLSRRLLRNGYDVVLAADGAEGLEMAAREARYAALAALPGPGDLLFTAHHQDDQAETVLLRLLRGSGPAALAGMPWQRPLGAGILLRPLLGESRAALEAEAHTLGLHWIEDASNASLDLDRNFLRHDILPRVAARWPACSCPRQASFGCGTGFAGTSLACHG